MLLRSSYYIVLSGVALLYLKWYVALRHVYVHALLFWVIVHFIRIQNYFMLTRNVAYAYMNNVLKPGSQFTCYVKKS